MFSALFQAISRPPVRYELDELEIRQWHTAQSVIVRLFGELWSTNIEAFQRGVEPLIDQAKRVVLLDLTGVTFLGSQGISAMIHFSNQLTAAGAELRIVAPASPIRETLELAHFHRVFKIHETVAGALVDRSGTQACSCEKH